MDARRVRWRLGDDGARRDGLFRAEGVDSGRDELADQALRGQGDAVEARKAARADE